MSNIEKLIAENKWRGIAEAPKDGNMLLIKYPRMMGLVVRGWYRKVHDQWLSDRGTDGGITKVEFFHEGDLFRPSPDDRLAEVCEVLLEGLLELRESTYECAADANEILQRANEIAEKGE